MFIGGSAGAIEAIVTLLGGVGRALDAPVLVALHVAEAGADVLPSILGRATGMPVSAAADGVELVPGQVYVAPRRSHLLADSGRARLLRGPREHNARPAIDPLFRSAARAYGHRAIGVVLSGMLDDGTAGLREIRRRGGHALVQEPTDASFPQMPLSAISAVDVDDVLPAEALGARIGELVSDGRLRPAVPSTRWSPAHETQPFPPGMRTDIGCPLCGGPVWEEEREAEIHYQCPAGHAYTAEELLAVQEQGLDSAIWRPVRLIRDRVSLMSRLAARARSQGRTRSAEYFAEQAELESRRADLLQEALDEARSSPRRG